MTVKMDHGVTLDISHDDLARIITNNFCDSYGALSSLEAVNIETNEGGGFSVQFSPRAPEPKEQKQ